MIIARPDNSVVSNSGREILPAKPAVLPPTSAGAIDDVTLPRLCMTSSRGPEAHAAAKIQHSSTGNCSTSVSSG
jgi:hypothetical protein